MMMDLRLCVAVCLGAAILSWIRCGALAFVVRTPSTLHDDVHSLHTRSRRSISLNSWFGSDEDVGVVTNWDSDQDEVELTERMEKKSNVDYKYWTVSSSTDESMQASETTTAKRSAKEKEKPHRRRSGFGMPGGTGATSEGIRFSVPDVYEDESLLSDGVSSELCNEKVHQPQTQQQFSRWYITLDDSTGLRIPLNTSIATKQPVNKTLTSLAAAVAAFQVKKALLETHDTTKPTKRLRCEKKVRQLSSLLNVPLKSARTMIRRSPSLVSMDMAGTLSRRCIDMSLLLQCTPSKFTSIVRHCPSLLTFRAGTIATKLVQLDQLLSGQSLEDRIDEADAAVSDIMELVPSLDSVMVPSPPLFGNQTSVGRSSRRLVDVGMVSESTLSIVRRVPQLLTSNVPGTLSKRAVALRSLLFGEATNIAAASYDQDKEDEAFVRVLKRCPELLLYNVEATIAPKLSQLNSLFRDSNFFIQHLRQSINSRKLGTEVALREPRLLLYDIEASLVPKVQLWRARVDDEASFITLLERYPTLLMYSFGAAARLEYFAYRNKRKPDASEARQLLMLSKKAVETWEEEQGTCLFDSTPAILGGTISKRGRPRMGESALEASKRRDARRAAQSCSPHQLEELKVGELRMLLREQGGIPASKRKSQLITELHTRGFGVKNETSSEQSQGLNDGHSSKMQPLLSYPHWISMKLCTSYPQFVQLNNDSKTAGDLEKLYGMALKRSIKANNVLTDVAIA